MASVSPEFEVLRPIDERRRIWSGNGLAVGSMLLFAAGFPAADMLLQSWHPLALMVMRLTMALAFLIPLWALIDGLPAIANANWSRALWIGALGFGTGTNFLLFAQWYTDPVTVALVVTATPIIATFIEVLGRQRRLTMRFSVGLAASLIGGAVAISQPLSFDLGLGVILAVAASICFTWASNAAVRDFPDLTALGRSTITFVGAALFTLVMFLLALAAGISELPTSISSNQLGLLAIYSIAAMALSQLLFIASIGRLGIALTTFHMNIVPFYVMIILIAIGGIWDWRAAIGAAIVGIGVVIAQTPAKRAKELPA